MKRAQAMQPDVILQSPSKLPFSSLEPGDEMTESVFENIHRALAAMTNL